MKSCNITNSSIDNCHFGCDPSPSRYKINTWASDFYGNLAAVIPIGLIAALFALLFDAARCVQNEDSLNVLAILLPGVIASLLCTLILWLSSKAANLLKMYGLTKGLPVWTIDFKNSKVIQVKIDDVYNALETFANTSFSCLTNEGDEIRLHGVDFFESASAAQAALDSIREANTRIISKYYPSWESDPEFVKFINSLLDESLGFNASLDYTKATLFPVFMHDVMMMPEITIEKLFDKYFNYIERIKESEANEQALITRIEKYRKGAFLD